MEKTRIPVRSDDYYDYKRKDFIGESGDSPEMRFEEFLKKENISPNVPPIPIILLKKAWNRALRSACERFIDNESVDYGAFNKFFVEE